MREREHIIGIYGDAKAAATDPNYLATLQGEIGLNLIIMGGEWNLTPATRAKNPCGPGNDAPGLRLSDDDSILRQGVEAAHRRGIRALAITGFYHGGAQGWPEGMAWDLFDRRVDSCPPVKWALEQAGQVFCPSNEAINAWYEASLADIAGNYEFDGSANTHFRYAHPASFHGLWSCGCPACERSAGELGYDFGRMKLAVQGLVRALQGAGADRLRTAAGLGLGLPDFLQMLDVDGGAVVDWINFRADVLSRNVSRFAGAVRSAAGNRFSFGSDIYYPSFALLVGHRYRDFAGACGHLLPLLSHVEFHALQPLAALANLLTEWAPGLSDRDALRLVYGLFGYDHYPMPETFADLGVGNPPSSEPGLAALPEIVAGEMVKARLYAGPEIRTYPVIKGSVWSTATVRRLMDAAFAAGHDGVVLQGTEALINSKK